MQKKKNTTQHKKQKCFWVASQSVENFTNVLIN